MSLLRVGTRGSDLALWQTRWVVGQLRTAHPLLTVEEIIIQTHGDVETKRRFDADWPVGGFVGAIEQALVREEIDFAVHSFKDLPTADTPGLLIAAVPAREAVHDVLVTREPVELDALPAGFRLGTSSPRRTAQFRRWADVEIVEIRGNVPTRVAKLERDGLDGVVLAAAGLRRLQCHLPYSVDLPTDRFVPTPAQGALAIQARNGSRAAELLTLLDDKVARRGISAERAFLKTINAGCQTPVGALATLEGEDVSLHGQLFDESGARMVEGVEIGDDPCAVGRCLAERLMRRLQDKI